MSIENCNVEEHNSQLELTILMPCLNEAETIGLCITKAKSFLNRSGINAEILVVDNGSSDGSKSIALSENVRVLECKNKGYGNALRHGIANAKGDYVIFADSDDSYDFSLLEGFIEQLKAGYDLVVGNRYLGGISPGAMPFHHRFFGNPFLTFVTKLVFGSHIGDSQSGMRGINRKTFLKIPLRSPGMEFASEMIIKAFSYGLRIKEIPIKLDKAGRSRAPHLRSFRDGWRHLRLLMLVSPKWFLIFPGFLFIGSGFLLYLLEYVNPFANHGIKFGVHSLLCSSLLVTIGYQSLLLGLAARVFALAEDIGPATVRSQKLFKFFSLERGLSLGLFLLVVGFLAFLVPFSLWKELGFSSLESYLDVTLRQVIFAATVTSLGFSTLLTSLFYGMLRLSRGYELIDETKM